MADGTNSGACDGAAGRVSAATVLITSSVVDGHNAGQRAAMQYLRQNPERQTSAAGRARERRDRAQYLCVMSVARMRMLAARKRRLCSELSGLLFRRSSPFSYSKGACVLGTHSMKLGSKDLHLEEVTGVDAKSEEQYTFALRLLGGGSISLRCETRADFQRWVRGFTGAP